MDIDAAAKLLMSAQTTASTLALLGGDMSRLPYMQKRMRYMANVLQVAATVTNPRIYIVAHAKQRM
jgi:hypothetical protein